MDPDHLSTVIAVDIVDDSVEELEETFTVSIVSVTPGIDLSPANATVTVVDDDGQGRL